MNGRAVVICWCEGIARPMVGEADPLRHELPDAGRKLGANTPGYAGGAARRERLDVIVIEPRTHGLKGPSIVSTARQPVYSP